MVNYNIHMYWTFSASVKETSSCQVAHAIIKGVYIIDVFQLHNFVVASSDAKLIKTFLGNEQYNSFLTFVDSFFCGFSSGFRFAFVCFNMSISSFFINFLIFSWPSDLSILVLYGFLNLSLNKMMPFLAPKKDMIGFKFF